MTLPKLHQPPFCHVVRTRDGGGITADHVLEQDIDSNATRMQVLFDPMPIRRLAQVGQEMTQPVITAIERLDALTGQLAQG